VEELHRGWIQEFSKDKSPPVGSRGKAPVAGLKDKVPQKLKQNVRLVYRFNVSLKKI